MRTNNWNILSTEEQINDLIDLSYKKPVLIFKHSTTCGISHSAIQRVEDQLQELDKNYHLYYLDLLQYRSVSNAVAKQLQVIHQSPQVIVLENGQVKKHASHYAIQPEELLK